MTMELLWLWAEAKAGVGGSKAEYGLLKLLKREIWQS